MIDPVENTQNSASKKMPRFGQKKNSSDIQSTEPLHQRTMMDALSSGLLLVQRFGTVAVIGYVFLGEVFLPQPLRASTFISTRIIHISELQKLDLATENAQAVTTEEVAKVRVQYAGKCQLDRQSTAMTIYSNCLRTRPVKRCLMRR